MLEKIGLKRINPKKGKPLELSVLENGCIVCTSHVPNKDGYVRVYAGKGESPRCKFLHRITWERENNTVVPKGYELDHICRTRACCNPDHLQLLTVRDHKIKTNLERYRDRIDKVISMIKEGKSTPEIMAECQVVRAYVTRYRRLLK